MGKEINNIFISQFDEIVLLIKQTRTNVIRLANAKLIDLYWNIGEYLHNKLSNSEWGDGVVKQLSISIIMPAISVMAHTIMSCLPRVLIARISIMCWQLWAFR